jgi:hypothetical protein
MDHTVHISDTKCHCAVDSNCSFPKVPGQCLCPNSGCPKVPNSTHNSRVQKFPN